MSTVYYPELVNMLPQVEKRDIAVVPKDVEVEILSLITQLDPMKSQGFV